LSVRTEVEPILKRTEPLPPEAAVSSELTLPVEIEVEPILKYAEQLASKTSVSLDLPLPLRAEVEPILEHTAPPAPTTALIPDVPTPAGRDVEPVLAHGEPPAPKASVSPDVARPVGAEIVEHTLDHAEQLPSEATVSPDMPPLASAKVEPIFGRAEPAEATANAHIVQKDSDDATGKSSEAIQLDPKVPVARENRSNIKSKAGGGTIGVTIRPVTDGVANALNVKPACGALIVGIDENGSAKTAGIEPRDVIIKVDGKDVKEWRDLPRIVADTSIGKEIAVTIVRNGKELTKTVKVA